MRLRYYRDRTNHTRGGNCPGGPRPYPGEYRTGLCRRACLGRLPLGRPLGGPRLLGPLGPLGGRIPLGAHIGALGIWAMLRAI